MAKSATEAELNDLLEEIEILKKDKKEQRRQLKELNETLISELKDILNPEVFVLVKSQLSSKWGQFQRLETTDAILTEYIKAVQNSRKSHTKELEKLSQQLQKCNYLRKEAEKQLQQVAEEADQQLDQLTSELNKSLSAQQDSKKTLFGTGPTFLPPKTTIQKKFVSKEVQASFANTNTEQKEKDNTQIVKSRSNSEMTFDDISKIVSRLVPVFSGERNHELSRRVYEFINACELALKSVAPGEEQILVSLLTTRLVGDAFELFRFNSPNIQTISDLSKLLKDSYLVPKTLDTVTNELKISHQFMGEDIKSFARRLGTLQATAYEIIDATYLPNESGGLKKEVANSVITTFKAGLSDPALRQYMLTNQSGDISILAEEARKTSLLLAQHQQQVNSQLSSYFPQYQFPMSPQPLSVPQQQPQFLNSNLLWNTSPAITQVQETGNLHLGTIPGKVTSLKCGFCNKPNHTYTDCRIRRNTPYCESCKAYGHGPGSCPKAQVFAASVKPSRKSKLKCDWCSRPGHSENECFSKKNYLAKHAPGNVIGASQNP